MATPVLVNGYTGLLATALPVRTTFCDVLGYHIFNPSNAAAFIHFYDSEVTPTVGTTVAVWMAVIPTLQDAFMTFPVAGLFFKSGLWMAATTSASGSSAPSAAVVVNLAMS